MATSAKEDGCTCRVERWYRLLVGEPPAAALDCPVHGVRVADDDGVAAPAMDGAA